MAEAIALHIDGMTCASCAEHVREALEKVPGVRSASVSYPRRRAEVEADADMNHGPLVAAMAALGYRARVSDTPNKAAGLLGKALGWLGSVRGQRAATLGVEHFGQTGTVNDLYRHFGIDAEAIVASARVLMLGH